MRTARVAVLDPQHVARVAVAVEPEQPQIAGAIVTALHAVERLRRDAAPRGGKVGRNEVVREQEVARRDAECPDVERRTMAEIRAGANGVNASEKAAHPLQGFAPVELRGAAAASRVDREPEDGGGVQRVPGEDERRDDRNLARGELGDERVLLADRVVRPARGPVELRDNRSGILDADQVDAILVAPERLQPAVAHDADAVQGVEDAVGRELRVGMHRVTHAGAHQ